MKKCASFLLALVMIFSLATVAFAADEYTITASDNGHTYEVYQIFTGDLDENGVLSNVKWGENGTGTTGEAVADAILEGLAAIDANASNSAKLEVITQYVDLTTTPVKTIAGGSSADVPAGYYLIKDQDGSVTGADSYTTYIVEVVDNVTITPKADVPTSEKKVDDKNDSNTTQDEVVWEDSADHDIGDEVPFKLTGKVASNYADYKTYYFAFHDDESAGLTFQEDSVKVYVDGNLITEGYEVVTTGLTDGCTFEVVFKDLKQIESVNAGSVITVEYTSVLNEKAVLGSEGNPNTMHLEFSNNPNDEQEGKPETGETPDDTVIVFTYKVVVNKVNENEEPLEGAGFTLYKKDAEGEWNQIGEELTGEALTTFEWKGLDDGDYKLVETTTPAGYNTIADIEFTITAEHEVLSDNPALTSLDGGELFTGEVSTGAVSADVVNKAGTTLPETGGIGTTIFYTLGGILVLAAVILLVTKKRMAKEA